MSNPIVLKPKQYQLQLVHPNYPGLNKVIDIKPDQTTHIKVDFDTLVGFLNCNVYPWGKVYINGKYQGDTPFKDLIRLMPGKYVLQILNPRYKEYKEEINILKQDTLNIKYNFELSATVNNDVKENRKE